MDQVKSIDGPPGRRSPRCLAAVGCRATIAALLVAGLGTACLADEAMSGLGSAFRPQAGADAPVPASGERTGANPPGLRVVVASPGRSVASIDGQIVRVGDIVNGMRVTEINQHGVVLMGEDGIKQRLMVNPSVVKRERPASATHVSNGARQ